MGVEVEGIERNSRGIEFVILKIGDLVIFPFVDLLCGMFAFIILIFQSIVDKH